MTVDDLRQRYLAAQLSGDRRLAIRLLLEEGLARGLTVTQLQFGVIQEAQREIGRLWQENKLSVAQEHLATAISQLALAQLYHSASARPRAGKKILVACVEGELHDFPARLMADHLDLEGYEVRFLGANVPTDSLVRMVQEERPDLIALSVTMSFHADAVRTAVRRLLEETPAIPIVIGGHACQWAPTLAEDVGAAGMAANGPEALALIARLLGVGAAPQQHQAGAGA